MADQLITMENELNLCSFVECCSHLTNIQNSWLFWQSVFLKQWDCAEFDDVLHRSLPRFSKHNKGHQEEVEIGFCTGMLGNILENNVFPGDHIVKN
jgi:hypothetical protein